MTRLRYRRVGSKYYEVTRQDTGAVVGYLAHVWPYEEAPWWSVEIGHAYTPFGSERAARRFLRDEAALAGQEERGR